MLMCNCAGKWNAFAPLILRVAVGLVFAMHGWQKLSVMGLGGTEGMLTALGFPMAGVFAFLLIAAELGGGILLILGLFTHWAAKVLIIVALTALFVVHIGNEFFLGTGGFEFMLLILASVVSVMITGPGKYSFDAKMHKHA